MEPTAMFPALWSTLINDVLTLYYRRKEVMTLLEPTAMFPALWSTIINDALTVLQQLIRYLPTTNNQPPVTYLGVG